MPRKQQIAVSVSSAEMEWLRDESARLNRSISWLAHERIFPPASHTSTGQTIRGHLHDSSTGETTPPVAKVSSEFILGAESSAAAPKLNQTLAAQKSRDDILRGVNRKAKK